MKTLLRDLYATTILFFYYFKYPIAIGWPVLRYVWHYPCNPFVSAVWVVSVGLIAKDILKHLTSKRKKD